MITFFLHIIWLILAIVRWHKDRKAKLQFLVAKKEMRRIVKEAQDLRELELRREEEERLRARRAAAEARLQAQLEAQAEADRKIREEVFARVRAAL